MPIRTLSRYELLEEIGRGNMGVVYKARDPAMERIVAVKIVHLGLSFDEGQRRVFLDRFHREAKIAGQLDHRHIVAVHDFGTGDEPFLVMEYFPGQSLAKLGERASLPPEEVALVARQLGGALAYAHDRGVVHRDVKPANVLYQPGLIKLVDFGVARLESSDLTATGEFLGTPSYMSPEIFSGATIDARSDLFSLGALVYQLLTGRKAFEGGNVSRTIYRVLHEDPSPPSALRSDLSLGWDVIVRRLLAKDPSKRYENAHALLEDLDRIDSLADRCDNPTVPITWKARRGHLGVAAALFVFLVGLLGLGRLRYFSPSPEESTASATPTSGAADSLSPEVSVSAPLPFLPLVFVARHEHRIGHCTGDLSFAETGVAFVTSRHGAWRWRPGEIDAMSRIDETELELRARSREQGKRGETETLRFTFLRPGLSLEEFRRYQAFLRSRGEAVE